MSTGKKFLDMNGVLYFWKQIAGKLDKKVDVVAGKGLSTKDFTEEYETKLKGLENYTLSAATDSTLGGVKIGSGIKVTQDGTISVEELKIASATQLGGVKIGDGLSITAEGVLSADVQELPKASKEAAGIVKIGDGINVNDGTISVTPYTLSAATNDALGGVKGGGTGITISAEGVISANIGSKSAAGIVKVGTGLSVTDDGTISVDATPFASAEAAGIVKIGSGISVNPADGTISVTPYTLPAATSTTLGGVIVGDGLTVDGDGKVSVNATPAASKEAAGIVKIGDGINVTSDGTISVTAVGKATTTAAGIVQIGKNITVDDGVISVADLAVASATQLGGVKAGTNMTAAEDGTLTVNESVVKVQWSNVQGTDGVALKSDIVNVYKYKGSVANQAALKDLEATATAGDVYDLQDTGMNVAWTGTAWDNLGMSFSIEEISNTEIDNILNGTYTGADA